MLDIALVGTGGMMPLPNRFLSSSLFRHNGDLLLIDCGEGTQVSLKMLGWGIKNIGAICFTHFHGDHISGLPGLLLSIGNAGRTEPILMIGPKELKYIVESLCVIARDLPFEMIFIEIEKDDEPITYKNFVIKAMPVSHGMPCFAYTIEIERKGKFDVEAATKLCIPKNFWSTLQKGESVEIDGVTYTSDMVMGPARKGLKVAYCTDTRPTKSLPDFIFGADLFVCEGIYAEDEKLEKAKEYKHMTFSEAATLAKEGQVRELWLTHYSPSLTEPEEFLHVATDIFENSHCGFDRKWASLLFEGS